MQQRGSHGDGDGPYDSIPRRWRVLKFGGTSVSSLARWQSIESILARRNQSGDVSVLLVCSAIAGVTDLLEDLVAAARAGDSIAGALEAIRERHVELARELGVDADSLLASEFARLESLASGDVDDRAEAEIMAHGELMSTCLGAEWLARREVRCAWVDARELLVSEPAVADRSEQFLSASCACAPDPEVAARLADTAADVVVTQGYIARSPDGDTVLLGRGGSDTSAAYLASKLSAERLEIWTDVPGLFTANPSLVPNARLLERVGYREAQALGALGAAVLHPRAIEAVWEHGVPIEIGWTERPDVAGTSINASRAGRGVKAITARKRLAMFSLRRPPSWQPIGFLHEVAGCFARRGLSMDLVSSSCSEIRVTIDLEAFPSAESEIPAILEELERSCIVRVIEPVASVSVVGERVGQPLFGSRGAFNLFAEEVVYMVVHAANEHHVTFVLDELAADRLVNAVHRHLLESSDDRHDLGPTWTELCAERAQRQAV
jgi:diaminopimelate decarboxylase/aspartate kinase